MEPVILGFAVGGAYKHSQPSLTRKHLGMCSGFIQVKVSKASWSSLKESPSILSESQTQMLNATKTTSKKFSRGDRFIFIIKGKLG